MSSTYSGTSQSLHSLLSRLWLCEPNADLVARATTELDLPSAASSDLAAAYTDLFLLNVYPYGTVFTDPSGELNGADAQRVATLYETHGYQPDELNLVGAPDHLGLCLGFLAHAEEKRLETAKRPCGVGDFVLDWAPVCCLAIEREPSAHEFYRALAMRTRETLLAKRLTSNLQSSEDVTTQPHPPTPSPEIKKTISGGGVQRLPSPENRFLFSGEGPGVRQTEQLPEDEVRLRDVVRFLLAPARCGVFLSRSRLGQLAREIGLRLPFGSRFEVAEMLFEAAGQSELIDRLLIALQTEIEVWATAYRQWAEMYSPWRPIAELWLARTTQAWRVLAEMRQIVEAAVT